MHARIITVGDELLIGQTVNSNATWIARQLTLIGLAPEEITVVPDRADAIQQTLERMAPEGGLVIVTGGLGPTDDDLTKTAVADFLGAPLQFHEDVFAAIERHFEERGLEMANVNRELARAPEGFEILNNTAGTAPGLWYEKDGFIIVLLPGVPREMKMLMTEEVMPRLEQRNDTFHTYRVLRTIGMPESSLHERLSELEKYTDASVQVAFLPHLGGVRLRLTVAGEDEELLEGRLDRLESYIQDRLGKYLYSHRDEGIEVVVGRLLKQKGLTIATAESCTGGAVADRLTDVPGASAYMRGGLIAYSNQVKIDQVDVEPDALEREGAVSSAIARQLAGGVREQLHTDIGISTTGIAGPSGGTPEKPVGTVWIGYADDEGLKAYQLHLTHDRLANKELTVVAALDLVRRRLLKHHS